MLRFLTTFSCLVVLVLQVDPASATTIEHDGLGDHHDSPVFFEHYKRSYFKYEVMPSLRRNRLKVANFPEVDLTGFDWKSGGIKDDSWWSGVERLTYLLPFIDSEQETDQELAKRWFMHWYDCHKEHRNLNRMAWNDAFVVAFRAMVLVFFLKTEEKKANPDAELIATLRLSIFDHQAYLSESKHFDADSNHGLLEAIALIEVTRVLPDSRLTVLGMDRVLTMADVSVSDLGCHMEHSPAYHFSFFRMVSEIHDYCKTIDSIPSVSLRRLSECRERMRRATYFLHDHRCNIPQIGDSDSVIVEKLYPGFCIAEPDSDVSTLYDPDAGYAIYKGHPSTGDRRYVVFTNQNKRTKLRYHFHDDALAVFYSYDGEVILGDQGKYEYTYTEPRQYFASPVAHNTIFPDIFLTHRKGRHIISLAAAASSEESSEAVRFNARMRHNYNILVERNVVIYKGEDKLCVFDNILSPRLGRSRSTTAGGDGSRSGPDKYKKRKRHPLGPRLAMVWNFGRDVKLIRSQAAKNDSSFVFVLETRGGRWFRLSIEFDGDFEASSRKTELVRGELSPMRGWYSPEMLVMRPAPALIITFLPKGAMNVSTTVELVPGGPLSGEVLFRGD